MSVEPIVWHDVYKEDKMVFHFGTLESSDESWV